MKKSIRQFAGELGLSHTAVRSAMADLGITGEMQGHGKPTLLDEAEQEQIAAKFFVPASFIQESRPAEQAGIVVQPSDAFVSVYQSRPLKLSITDSTAQLTEAIKSLDTTLKQWISNGDVLETALIQHASMQGTELGTRIALNKVGNAVRASETIELELAKKLGLVQDPPATR